MGHAGFEAKDVGGQDDEGQGMGLLSPGVVRVVVPEAVRRGAPAESGLAEEVLCNLVRGSHSRPEEIRGGGGEAPAVEVEQRGRGERERGEQRKPRGRELVQRGGAAGDTGVQWDRGGVGRRCAGEAVKGAAMVGRRLEMRRGGAPPLCADQIPGRCREGHGPGGCAAGARAPTAEEGP